jgi:uncharacterized protein
MDKVIFYAVLVFVLTIPFWVAGALVDVQLMPGLPVAALALVVPTLAAAIVLAGAEGRTAVAGLFGRVRDIRRMPLWGYFVSAGLAVVIAATGWASLYVRGEPVAFVLPLIAVIPLILALIGGAMLEEFGWTGFATEPLSLRFGVLGGALILGVGSSVWHYPALVEVHRGIGWIAWWTIWTVAQRVTMVALYERTGRNFWAPVVFHASANFVWQVAPDAFDPMVQAIAAAAVATAVMLGLPRGRTRPRPPYDLRPGLTGP